MEKETYFVTVDGTINTVQNFNDAPYDYEILASDAEIQELQVLFQRAYNEDFTTFFQANLPYRTEEREKENYDVDRYIQEIYAAIYRLGSEETKKRLKETGLA